jgi:outer membrane protein assembly factor BamB
MARPRRFAILFLSALLLSSCASQAKKPLVDPFPLRFPLVEAGTLEIEGHVVGQPRARDGIVYYATREGSLTAVVVPSRFILWRKPVEGADPDGDRLAGLSSGPESPALKVDGAAIRATDRNGVKMWEFAAKGTISAEPAVRDGRVYFGTAERMFYCLNAKSGKRVWSRRLQGAPLHLAVIRAGTLAVPASNSVVYLLSARGGSVLSWETVASRILYELAAADPLVLVSSATPDLVAIDLRTGKRAGQFQASGALAAGALWVPPFVVLFEEAAESGRQRIVFLRSR